MYPNFILLLFKIIILHGYKDRGRQKDLLNDRALGGDV